MIVFSAAGAISRCGPVDKGVVASRIMPCSCREVRSACSGAASYKPPMLETRVRLPACAVISHGLRITSVGLATSSCPLRLLRQTCEALCRAVRCYCCHRRACCCCCCRCGCYCCCCCCWFVVGVVALLPVLPCVFVASLAVVALLVVVVLGECSW